MISKIIISNFKSIKHVDLDLKPLNVLIGANGAGKSNFISFFELLNNIYNQNLQNYVKSSGGADNLLYYGLKASDFIWGYVHFSNKDAYSFKLCPNKMNNLYFQSEENTFYQDNKKMDGEQSWDIKNGLNTGFESSLKSVLEHKKNHNRIYYENMKFYHFQDTGKTSKMKQECKLHDNSKLREDASNLAAFLYYLQQKHPITFNLIEDVIRSVAPFFKEFDLQPNRLNPEYIQLEWKEKDSDKYFNAHNLSDGTLRFICLATLLLQADLNSTIIIDEPELGLHPFAINKLAGLIKSASSKTQIIVSTQSVNLIDNFEPDDIIVVDRNAQSSEFKRLNESSLKDWLDDYTIGELWDKNIIGGRP